MLTVVMQGALWLCDFFIHANMSFSTSASSCWFYCS